MALGGAPSVNRLRLTEGVDWWPSEVIQEEHVEATIAGGHAEVMLTHDSPGPPYCTRPVAEVMRDNPNGWPDSILSYAAEGINRMTRAVLGVNLTGPPGRWPVRTGWPPTPGSRHTGRSR